MLLDKNRIHCNSSWIILQSTDIKFVNQLHSDTHTHILSIKKNSLKIFFSLFSLLKCEFSIHRGFRIYFRIRKKKHRNGLLHD